MTSNLTEIAKSLVEKAKQSGACDADAMVVADTGESVEVRNGKVESIEREDALGMGLRAFVRTANGPAFATASTSDVSDAGLKRLVDQVISMAYISEADPDAVSPSGAKHPAINELAAWEERHSTEDSGWNTEVAKVTALACEDAAVSYSSNITNSEGAEGSFGQSSVAYACADGFTASYQKSSASLSASVIAGSGEGMQRDYAWHTARHSKGLKSPEEIGREAAMRATRRLGATGIKGGEMTVIFEPRVATSLIRHLISAINGHSVLQERTFLANSEKERIFPEFINITDDPDHPRGMGNRLFDGEGTRCQRTQIIEQGVLKTFLTNRYAANRLGRHSTGHARRGLTGDIGIGTSNIILEPGHASVRELLLKIGDGLFVTELMGFGVNGVTGDYSRGAAGFLVENGQTTRPVQGITIAGNLKEMFANIACLADDLTWFGSSAVPTVAITGMTVAGQG